MKRKIAILVTVLVLAFAGASPAQASHKSGPGVSYGQEWYPADHQYMGVSATHDDLVLSINGTNCSTFNVAAAHPMRQSIKIDVGSDGDSLELGTLHQCSGNRWQYWGRWRNFVWTTGGTRAVVPVLGGRIISRRQTSNWWDYIYDGTTVGSYFFNTIGYFESAGIFDCCNGDQIVPSHTYRGLRYRLNSQCCLWFAWGGQDGYEITYATGYDGQWLLSPDGYDIWRAEKWT
jgi:hypothetical protein